MHPAFYSWWKHARRGHGCGEGASAGPWGWGGDGPGRHGPFAHGGPGGHGHGGHGHGGHGHGGPEGARFGGPPDDFFGGGGPFGVRRPLRFLAHKLDLSEPQVGELARILDDLKTERAQAEVDHRRTVASFSDALEDAMFDEAKAREGGELRVKSAERLRDAVTKALARIHAVLDEDQRKRLAYLLRTGVVSL